MTTTTAPAPAATQDGSALAERVLASPEGGSSLFFPATADGSALQLLGFGFGLALLSMVNTEWIRLTSIQIVVPAALGFAAIATILGSMWSFRANNMFGGVWGVVYGGFWISAALIVQIFGAQITKAAGATGFSNAFGAYLLLYAIVTLILCLPAYFVARPAFIAFVLLAAVFLLEGLSNLVAPDSPTVGLRKLGGYVGLVDALVAWYVAAVLILNTTANRQILPLWPYPYGR